MAKKTTKKKLKERLFIGGQEQFPGCCGAEILEDLHVGEPDNWTDHYGIVHSDEEEGLDDSTLRTNDWRNAKLSMATTIPSMKKEIVKLKIAGFRPVISWMGNHGNRITLWASPAPRANLRFLKGKE